jgi:biopolymer transport protein ExbB
MSTLCKISFITLLTVFLSTDLLSSNFKMANDKASEDLSSSLQKLSEKRENIAEEKIPLLTAIRELESEVRTKQSKVDRQLRLRDNRDMNLERLKNQVKDLKNQNAYFSNLLDEFVNQFETSIDYSEIQLYGKIINEATSSSYIKDSERDNSDTFISQVKVVSTAISRLKNILGGYSYNGKGITEDGEVVEGTYSAFGPSVYFKSNDNSVQGIADTELNSATSVIKNPGKKFHSSINSYIDEGSGSIPFDSSLGNALKVADANESVVEHISKGGAVGLAIIFIGLLSLGVGIIKYGEVMKFKSPTRQDVQDIISYIMNDDIESAHQIAKKSDASTNALLKTAIDNYRSDRARLEELLYEKIISSQPKLMRFLPFMAVTAAAAPLMGLLGTVTGMINTFSLITIFGTGDAKSLSSGISEALVTTELGLIVAIPSLIFHALLSRMAKEKISDLDNASVTFINGISNLEK